MMWFRKKTEVARIEPTFTLEPAYKKVAFFDGDQDAPKLVAAYNKHVKHLNCDAHFITVCTIPKVIKEIKEFKITRLEGYTRGKEITDKYIGAMIQQYIADGYNHITVVSSDYDFIDIFKMAVKLCKSDRIKFTLIAPNAEGRLVNAQVAGIEIIRMNNA